MTKKIRPPERVLSPDNEARILLVEQARAAIRRFQLKMSEADALLKIDNSHERIETANDLIISLETDPNPPIKRVSHKDGWHCEGREDPPAGWTKKQSAALAEAINKALNADVMAEMIREKKLLRQEIRKRHKELAVFSQAKKELESIQNRFQLLVLIDSWVAKEMIASHNEGIVEGKASNPRSKELSMLINAKMREFEENEKIGASLEEKIDRLVGQVRQISKLKKLYQVAKTCNKDGFIMISLKNGDSDWEAAEDSSIKNSKRLADAINERKIELMDRENREVF